MSWKDPEVLGTIITEIPACYLGSTPCQKGQAGNVASFEAVSRILELANPTKNVIFIVGVKGLFVFDEKTKAMIKENEIGSVSYVALDGRDKKLFTYITIDRKNSLTFCHVYRVKQRAQDIPVAINTAFKISAGSVKEDEMSKKQLSRKLSVKQAMVQSLEEKKLVDEKEGDVSRDLDEVSKGGKMKRSDSGSSVKSNGSGEGSGGEGSGGSISRDRKSSVVEKKTKKGGVLGVHEAKYIGCIAVSEKKGIDVVDKAIQKAGKLTNPPELVTLIVTSEGIRTLEGLTGETIENVFIKNVSFTTVAGPLKNFFAYIAVDDRLKRTTCQIFQCAGTNSFAICQSIGLAFEASMKEQKEANLNPFDPISEKRDPPTASLEHKQISRRTLTSIKALGAGQFGQVYLANISRGAGYEPIKCAVKLLRAGSNDDDKMEFLRELESMVHIEHPNCCRLLGVAVQQQPQLCVIEFMQYGDLKGVLSAISERNLKLNEKEFLHSSLQIAMGMEYLASKRFIHMDLAARNVLVHTNSTCKVADFGLTQKLDENGEFYLRKLSKLPMKWLAVEAMNDRLFSEASDVWAYGVTIWELRSYGETPYVSVKNTVIQKEVTKGLRLAQPKDCPLEQYQLMKQCFSDRKNRITFFELVKALTTSIKESDVARLPSRDIGLLGSSGTSTEAGEMDQTYLAM